MADKLMFCYWDEDVRDTTVPDYKKAWGELEARLKQLHSGYSAQDNVDAARVVKSIIDEMREITLLRGL